MRTHNELASARPAAPRHAALVSRALEQLDVRPTGSLHVVDLCALAGASERTLRSAFVETFGIGPHRYLRLRRLHLIRAALAVSDPRLDTVATIAARLGCSDCGRMAAEYRALFGEFPSVTLRRRITARS